MCNAACIEFAASSLTREEVAGKRVLEVGSMDHNGSVRSTVSNLGPDLYVGIDLDVGPGVDVVCDANQMLHRFGPEAFDVVIATELLEHVLDWRRVVVNLKGILAPRGTLLITTRSMGYPYHPAPEDWWRFELYDMRDIFGDMRIERLESDPLMPGVFMKAKRPVDMQSADLRGIRLYSMLLDGRVLRIPRLRLYRHRLFRSGLLPRLLRAAGDVTPRPIRRRLRRRLIRTRVGRLLPPSS